MILWRASFRYVLHHRWQTALAIVGVALGVGVVTAVDLANQTAHRAFRLAAETIAGKATHLIVGGVPGLPESIYPTLRVACHIRAAAPVVEGHVQVAGQAGTSLRLIGIDPFAEPPIRSYSSRFSTAKVLEVLLTVPNTGLMLQQTAARLGVKKGRTFKIHANGTTQSVMLADFIEPGDELTRTGLESVLVTDVATAQELLGMRGRISHIDLVIPEGDAGNLLLSEIRQVLPVGTTIVPAGARAGALDQMTRAFRLNLTALSLLAVVVGMFLIYNTTTFSVIGRRRFIGLLRAIGVTRREIFALVATEVFLVGIAGTAAGLLFGTLLGEEVTRLVTRTINDLYFDLQVHHVRLLPLTFAKAAILGLGATVAAALPPILEATGATPRAALARSVLEGQRRKSVTIAAFTGIVTIVAGCGLLLLERGGINGGFAGLFILIIGYALMVPGATVLISYLSRPVMGWAFGVLGGMASRGVVVSLSRTGVATTALVVAVAAGIGVGIMVDSFRLTVQRWLDTWLRADIYVTAVGPRSGRIRPPLDQALVERLSRVPGATSCSLTRRVSLEPHRGAIDLLAMQQPQATFAGYRFKEGTPAKVWESFAKGESVVVSEPYAYRHNLHVGNRVTLPTPQGDLIFPVSGIFYDYGSDAGIIGISRSTYIRFWHDTSVDGMGFYVRNGVSLAELSAQIRERAGESRITVVTNRELKDASLAVFDRTFAVTAVLRVIIIVVAFVGVLSSLMAIQVDRARELAVARAIGLTPPQVWGLVCGETLLMGMIAGVLSLPLGIAEAYALTHVINRRSFGWTMEFAIDPALLFQAIALSIAAALLAGIYPSMAITRTSPALALKEEG